MSAAGWKNCVTLLRLDLRCFYPGTVALSVLWLALAPLLFGIDNLDSAGAGYVLERYASVIGVFLFPRVLLPEQEENLREAVEAKAFPRGAVFLGRFALSAGLTGLLLGGFVGVLLLRGGSFSAWGHLSGALSTALALGALCLFTLAVSGNVVAGYFPPLVLYLLCLFLGPGRLGRLYLFGLSAGLSGGKGFLAAAALILTAAALAWQALQRKIR